MNTTPCQEVGPAVGAAPQPSRGHGILVVDDDEGMRQVLNVWLRHQGYGVWTAATSAEAVDLYTHHRDAISVVLLDVHMPVTDGPQTLIALRQLNPQVCCCFMSGSLNGNTEMDLCDMSAHVVLQKPFRLVDLEAILWKLAAPIQRLAAVQDGMWRDDGGEG
jgi:CheY-like chemotaxis protein